MQPDWLPLLLKGLLCWWARQDSNLQPDRYERPALTIELQAPPRDGSRETRPATVRGSFTGTEAGVQCWRRRLQTLARQGLTFLKNRISR